MYSGLMQLQLLKFENLVFNNFTLTLYSDEEIKSGFEEQDKGKNKDLISLKIGNDLRFDLLINAKII